METTNVLLELSRSDLADLAYSNAALITDVKQLSSYNWIEADLPTIAVPGCPPVWSNIRIPRKLAKDSGHVYIAQNHARHPSSPLEPLFRSVYENEPNFDLRSIDIVSDRNNFRKLMSFIDPLSDPHGADSFGIKVEIVGTTALLDRIEAAVEETIGPLDFRGFGHNFKKIYTHNEIKNSTGHHRVVSYRFADLGVIVRHETDGYVNNGIPDIEQEHSSGDDLAHLVSSLTLSNAQNASERSQPGGSGLNLLKQGRLVAREATLEIKTRNSRNPLKVTDVAAQLWLSQTPQLVRAHHDRGVFQVPAVEDVTGEIRRWENEQQASLKILAALLRKIRDITTHSTGKRTIVSYDKSRDTLTVSRAAHEDMLPKDLYNKWDFQGPAADVKSTASATGNVSEQVKRLDDTSIGDGSQKYSIVVGNTTYESLPLQKLPNLASWFKNEKKKSPATLIFKHDEIPLFPVALTAVKFGWRQVFRQLDAGEISQLKTLISTLTYLDVDVLQGKTLDQVFMDLKTGKQNSDWDEDSSVSKSLARDAAFQLAYLLLQNHDSIHTGIAGSDPRTSNKFYNAILYIAGHLRTFKYKTRHTVLAVYLHCESPSAKQQAELRKWSSDRDVDELDETTSEESDSDSDIYYDSDFSL